MTIIWSGEIWRKDKGGAEYRNTTNGSKKMVIAFFIIALAIAIWILLPNHNKIESYKDFVNKTKQEISSEK